jgi:acyl-CoA hydrolase
MNLQEQINQAETRIFKTVFPNTTNHYDTLFGGSSFMMDEVALLLPLERRCVCSSDKIDFTKPPSWNYYRTYRHNNSYWNTSRRES